MGKCKTWFGCVLVVAALIGPGQARAGIITYVGTDPGAGPADPRPNSNASAASFDSAAGALNPLQLTTFEGLPLNQPASDGVPLTVAPGVSLTVNNADHSPPSGFSFGVSNNPNDASTGYNTTLGGSQHFKFVPLLNAGTATLNLTFSFPIQAFGLYLTGLGNAAGELHLLFNDGTPQDLLIQGSALGGSMFYGFTDQGTFINSVTFQLRNVSGPTRDTFGLDDIRLAPSVAEPASSVLTCVGLVGLILLGRHGLALRRAA